MKIPLFSFKWKSGPPRMNIRDVREASNTPALRLNEVEIEEFLSSRCWLAVRRWAVQGLADAMEDMFDPNASCEKKFYANGWIDAVKTLLQQPEVFKAALKHVDDPNAKWADEEQESVLRSILDMRT